MFLAEHLHLYGAPEPPESPPHETSASSKQHQKMMNFSSFMFAKISLFPDPKSQTTPVNKAWHRAFYSLQNYTTIYCKFTNILRYKEKYRGEFLIYISKCHRDVCHRDVDASGSPLPSSRART